MTGNFLNDLTGVFVQAIQAGTLVLQTVSIPLLAVMAGITFHRELWPSVLSGGAHLGESLGTFLYLLLRVGFFMWICSNLIEMADAALQTFLTWGVTPADFKVSMANLRAPSWILDTGFTASKPILTFIHNTLNWTLGFGAWFYLVGYVFAYLVILIAFAIIALHLSALLIEFHLAVLTATITFPWSFFHYTGFLGEFVIGWITGGLIRAFVLSALVGVAIPLFDLLTPTYSPGGDPTWYSILVMGMGAAFFAYLCWVIPARAAAIAGRGVSLAFHGGTIVSSAMSGARWAMMAASAGRGAVRGASSMVATLAK